MKSLLLWIIVWLGFSFASYGVIFAVASFIAWDIGVMSALAHRSTLAVCLVGFGLICIGAAVDEMDK
jgi:hypothetical protein